MLNCDVSVMCNVDSLSTPYHIYCSSCSCRIALECIATTLCVTFWYTKFDGTKYLVRGDSLVIVTGGILHALKRNPKVPRV